MSRQVPTVQRKVNMKKNQIKNEEATERLTKKHLTNRFDNAKQKGLAFLEMSDSRDQTGHLILKNGYLLQQTTRFAGPIHSHLRLAFCQR
jgi:hypothetical protein